MVSLHVHARPPRTGLISPLSAYRPKPASTSEISENVCLAWFTPGEKRILHSTRVLRAQIQSAADTPPALNRLTAD